MPQTLCHLDALSSNLLARRHTKGQEQTVALDWASVGKGAIGEEICQLVVNSLTVFDVAPANAERLDELAFQGYLEGLREVGWRGDERLVRLGYAASAAVRWGWIAPEFTLSLALDEQRRADVEGRWGRPVEEIIEWRAAVISFLLERADEARDLMATTS